MKSYPVGAPVTVTLPFVDLNGDPVTPTGLSYTVTDEDGAVVAGPITPAVVPGDTDIDITVDAGANNDAGARVVSLSITTAAGVFPQEAMYALVGTRLVFLQNTFQTLVQAELTANDMPGMTGWAGGTSDGKNQALIEAFARLTRLNYLVRWPQNIDDQSIYHIDQLNHISPVMWPLMTEDIFSRYPAVFTKALRQAQVAEANDLLTGDPVGDKIRAGLLSETVGESSMMFRSGARPFRGKLCNTALKYLTGYLDNRITLTRS